MPWHTVLEFLLHTTTKIGAVFMENTTTSPDVLERYAASRLWRTDRDGALRIVLGEEAALSAWRSTRPRYWHDR